MSNNIAPADREFIAEIAKVVCARPREEWEQLAASAAAPDPAPPESTNGEVPRAFEETPELKPFDTELSSESCHGFYLEAWDNHDKAQSIVLSREEYIAAKRFIGLRRGVVTLNGSGGGEHPRTMSDIEALEVIDSASGSEAELMAKALIAVREDCGMHTPVENFIACILRQHAFFGDTLTPEDAAKTVSDFRENVEWAVALVRDLPRKHPQLFEDPGDATEAV
ncbi:hypothetical protein F183_A29640 [Bryobacterales bacterium F-183]|nr:hypothetical protein F183_A29640 [Bryobacterales bacterium F-183]